MFSFKIIHKQTLTPTIKRLDILAPEIVPRIRPGQFVMATALPDSPRIPLTPVETDAARGMMTLIIQESDPVTKQLGGLQINEEIFNILGPLGTPSTIEKVGIVVGIASGMGATQILPLCRAHKKIGNKVIGIIGAKTQNLLMLEAQMRLSCHKILIATNDGSYMKRGLATDLFRELSDQENVNLVYAAGPVDMMQSVFSTAREKNVPTRITLNPPMLDGTGICGSCRVSVGGRTVLACLEGPEFDAALVDFADLKIRMGAWRQGESSCESASRISPIVQRNPQYQSASPSNKESPECSNPKSIPSLAAKESGTFKKFLSGILKNKP